MTAILSEETRLRDQIVAVGRSLFERRLTHGATGNISVRLADGRLLMTPTDASLGALEAERLAVTDADGRAILGDRPTKEAFLHACMYCERGADHAVVHLHSTHSVAVSLLADIDPANVLPPLTAYHVMRVGAVPLVPYFPPGDETLALAVKQQAGSHHALLLANHGPVVSGRSLRDAVGAVEELEETAKLFLMLDGRPIRPLTAEQVAELERRFRR